MFPEIKGPTGLFPQILDLGGPQTTYEVWRDAEDKFSQRDYVGAATALEGLLADPESLGGHGRQVRELLARSYFLSARNHKAVEAARSALELDPDNGYLVLLLSRSLERVGEKEEAATYKRLAAALGAEG